MRGIKTTWPRIGTEDADKSKEYLRYPRTPAAKLFTENFEGLRYIHSELAALEGEIRAFAAFHKLSGRL